MGIILETLGDRPIEFQERFKKAGSREAFATPQYDSSLPIVAVRALKNKGTGDFGKLQLELLKKLKNNELTRIEAQFEAEKYWAGALRKAVQDGDIEHGSLMSGQSVGLVNEIKSVKKILADLLNEAEQEVTAAAALLCGS